MRQHNNNTRRDSGPTNLNRFSNGNRDRFNSTPAEMHKAVCADCKAECEVPFKPSGDRPVYCRDCFSKHKPQRF